jgi:hypothetical protein
VIIRAWQAVVPVSATAAHLDWVRDTALSEYLATPGNRGAWCLYRTESENTYLRMLTLWDDSRLAPAHVLEYEAYPDAPQELPPGETLIARVWEGMVPIAKAQDYWQYLADFGFRDYQSHAGHRAAFLLRRTEAQRMHFMFLSFWTSYEAIAAYAGPEISVAHYYRYDLECLIDPAPRVEHYAVMSGDRTRRPSPRRTAQG